QDDKPAVIPAGSAPQYRVRSLAAMARILLTNGYNDEIVVAGFEKPDSLYFGNSRLLYRVPNRCSDEKRRINQGRIERLEMGKNGDNRIISVEDVFDINNHFVPYTRSVIAGPFGEGPFFPRLHAWRRRFSHEHQFRLRRNGQERKLVIDDLHRPISKSPCNLIFRETRWRQTGSARDRKQYGIDATTHRDGGVFTLAPVFLKYDFPMLTRRHIHTQRFFIVGLSSIGPDIDPAAVGVFGNDSVHGADVSSAI